MNIVALHHYALSDETTGSFLQDFDFTLAPGEACSITADNPDTAHLLAGALATLVRPVSGRYVFMETALDFSNYRNLLDCKKKIGYFGPDAALISNATVRENLLLARCYFENTLDLDLEDKVKKLCSEFHLTNKLDLRPTALSPLDIRSAILVRELTKPLQLLIIDSPEDLIGHPGFGFSVELVVKMVTSGIPLVLICENDTLAKRLTNRKTRLPTTTRTIQG